MKNIIVEGHRGFCAHYPENTLISFDAAIELGVDAVEFDVWLTSDKVPVLMHDESAYRTCGVDVNLRDLTLEEVKKLDAGYAKKFGDGELESFKLTKEEIENAVNSVDEKTIELIFEEKQKSVTLGQFAVLYDENENCLGGGIIDVLTK